MNLKIHLILRIIGIAVLCFIAATAYELRSVHQQSQQQGQQTAEAISKQLALQLLWGKAGFGDSKHFPDLDVWREFTIAPGTCIRFLSLQKQPVRSFCAGEQSLASVPPAWFANGYRWLFSAGEEIIRPVNFNGQAYGSISVIPSAAMQTAKAWEHVIGMAALTAMLLSAVCLMVYVVIARSFQPVKQVVAGLATLQQGNLAYRLPPFELREWQQTGAAINALASEQQQLLAQRRALIVQLLAVQEQERRYLARELHDEFGQCLAAINAITAAIEQTAERDCPAIMDEVQQVQAIAAHMMDSVRGLLQRLRPADIEELGLVASLDSLVAAWDSRGNCRYQLLIDGDGSQLPEAVAIAIFRISQECLTNIAKHASATEATLSLAITDTTVSLSIADNGIATTVPTINGKGFGLLGIYERVAALDGQLHLAILPPQGLQVSVLLPRIAGES